VSGGIREGGAIEEWVSGRRAMEEQGVKEGERVTVLAFGGDEE